MAVSIDMLRLQLDYTAWATRRLLDAAAQLSPEELTQDFKTADGSILNTLAHVFASERAWLARLQTIAPSAFITDNDRNFQFLQDEWPQLHERWKNWSLQLDDASAGKPLAYKELKGNQHTQPIWQLVLHVVNHGTHHRGQVAGFLRSLGYSPPPLDLVLFYRLSAEE